MARSELFATPLGRSLFWAFRLAGEGALPRLLRGVASMAQYLELRRRWIEAALDEARPDLVVELDAALARRGVTCAEPGCARSR